MLVLFPGNEWGDVKSSDATTKIDITYYVTISTPLNLPQKTRKD